MLKDPRIIILDEPTSALDSFAEEAISEAMHNLFAGRTVIIIAHRLQTVKNADDIIVIENGQIIERGSHTELVNQ
jgi:ABC-type multidrug transport system fused ATPase/permease subunit